MIEVQLTWTELMMAANVGVMRRLTSLKEGYSNGRFSDQSDWDIDIDGACGECAFAKLRGFYWNAGNRTFKSPDVENWQVRATRYEDGHLIVRPKDKDPDNTRYVLVICDAPNFKIVGSMSIFEAKQEEYWRKDKNSWWVPQSALDVELD